MATITLNWPDAITPELCAGLAEALTRVNEDDEIRVATGPMGMPFARQCGEVVDSRPGAPFQLPNDAGA